MAIQATVKNIADNAWPLVKLNSGGGTSLATHLGSDGAKIVARHFPANWLNSVKVKAVATIPTPDLNKLWAKMKYKNIDEFKKACDSIDFYLFKAIRNFSAGGATFIGIAYDKTIYLKAGLQHSLDLVVHELVHTLQWAKFTPEEFLRRYIQGYVKAKLVYQNNPAEALAYKFESKFRTAVNSILVNSGGTKLADYHLSMAKLAPSSATNKNQIIKSLKSMKPLNITKTSATADMYHL